MATEKEEKAFAKTLVTTRKTERALVDTVLKTHLTAARGLPASDFKKSLIGQLTQVRSDVADARAGHDASLASAG